MKTVGYLPKATKPKDDANKPAKSANGNKPKDDAKTATGDTADNGKDSGAK